MSVETNGGGLSFDARINLSQLEQDADKAVKIVSDAVEKASKAEQDILRKISGGRKEAVQDGLEALKSLTPEMQKQVAIVQTFQSELKGVSDAQKELDKALSKGVITQKEYNLATQGLNVRQAQINENIRKYTDSIRANDAIMNASKGSVDQKRLKLQQLTSQYYALSDAERENARIGGRMAREIRELDKEVSKLTRSLSGATTQNRLFNQIALATAGLFTINQAGRFANDIIRVRGELEQLEIAFTTILKSKQAADNLISEITSLAITTPFKITELADGAKQLLAYGFAASEVKEELIAIGNVASGTGSTFNEVAYAYGTLRSQGRAFARDIRQFTGRGIPIVAELAKQFGVSEERVNELVSAGKVGFPEVQKAFQGMTREGGIFFNLMQEQSKSVTGQISNLQDAIQLMFNDIGEGNEGLIKSGIAGLTSLVNNYEKVVDILKVAVLLYGSYRAALLLTIASQRLAALSTGGMTAAQVLNNAQTVIATRLTALWGAAMNALPIVALTSAIALLVGSIIAWNQSVDGAVSAAESLKDIRDEAAISAEKERGNIEELVKILKSEVASLEQKESAYKSLQSILGPYLEGLSKEEIAAGKATKAINDYTAALQQNVATKEAFAKYQELGDQILELEKKGGEALGFFQKQGLALRESLDFEGKSFGDILGGLFFVGSDDLAQRQIENLRTWREELAKTFNFTEQTLGKNGETPGKVGFDALIGNTSQYFETLIKIATDKSQFEKIKEGLTNQLEALAPNDPQIAELKKKILRVNEVLKSYSLDGENKAIKDSAKDRKKILDEISKLEDEAFKDSFSKREQEINAVRKQFAELREEAEKAGLGAGVQDRINRLEEKTTGNIVYRDETQLLKEELEKRKALYREFDKTAQDFGIQAAEERYGKELDLARTYLEVVQDEFEKLSAISPENRTGVQKERFEVLEKEFREEKRYQQQKYDDFLLTVQSYEMERSQIIERYILLEAELRKNGDLEYLNQLKQNLTEELNALDDAQFQKLDVYKRFYQDLDYLNTQEARKAIADLKARLELERQLGKISDEQYKQVQRDINKAELQIDERLPTSLREIANQFRTISQEVGGVNTGLGKMLAFLGDSIGRIADLRSNLNAYNEAREKGDALGSISAGLGVVGAAVGAYQTLVKLIDSIGKKQLEIFKKQLEFQRNLVIGQLEYNALERERTLLAAKNEQSTLKNLLAQREALLANSKAIEDDIRKIEEMLSSASQQEADFLNNTTKAQEGFLNNLLNSTSLVYRAISNKNKAETEQLFAELQKGLFVTGQKVVRSGFLGLGKKLVDTYGSLAGLSFEEIEQLSLNGQLTEDSERIFQQLLKLKQEGVDVENQLKDIDDALKSIFTGNQTAINIADTLIEGFRQGKRAAEDFGADIEEILRNAILSGFKYRFLEEPLNALLEQLYNDAVSDDDLSSSEVQNFQDQISQIIEQYGAVFDQIAASTGIDLAGQLGGQQSGLAGGIRRELTEETAGELAGLWRGQFDITKRHFQVGQDQLAVQLKIEQNTFIAAQELKIAVTELQKISKNTDPASGRGQGYDD